MIVLQTIAVALSMYSALPMPQFAWDQRNMRCAMAAFPLVGVFCGAAVWLWAWLCGVLEFGPVLTGAGIALAPVVITGGIHLDGFCDTVDALASHQTREKKLEILKDPHTGAFAVMGCAAYLLFTFALWSQPEEGFRLLCTQMMAVGYVFSRAMSAFAVVTFDCAKNSGLAHSFSSAAQKSRVRAVSAVVALLCAVLFLAVDLRFGAAILVVCALTFWYYHHMAYGQFGGVTGDLAGWYLQVNELMILLTVVVGSMIALNMI